VNEILIVCELDGVDNSTDLSSKLKKLEITSSNSNEMSLKIHSTNKSIKISILLNTNKHFQNSEKFQSNTNKFCCLKKIIILIEYHKIYFTFIKVFIKEHKIYYHKKAF
jgi:hypothetical protein